MGVTGLRGLRGARHVGVQVCSVSDCSTWARWGAGVLSSLGISGSANACCTSCVGNMCAQCSMVRAGARGVGRTGIGGPWERLGFEDCVVHVTSGEQVHSVVQERVQVWWGEGVGAKRHLSAWDCAPSTTYTPSRRVVQDGERGGQGASWVGQAVLDMAVTVCTRRTSVQEW